VTDTPIGSPGMVGSEPKVGRPGIDVADGRLGSELTGRAGIELAGVLLGAELPAGRLGSELAAGTAGSELAAGRLGSELAPGRLGSEPAVGRLGTAEGGVTQIWSPLVLDVWIEALPAGEAAVPLPAIEAGIGMVGAEGVATHCFPVGRAAGSDVGRDVGRVVGNVGTARRDETPGTDVGNAVGWLAPLGKTLAAPIAIAATPAAPPVSRMMRP
jgi:hypothetical protein